MKNQAGISLSETLISLFLVSIILMMLIQFYIGSKKQYIALDKRLTSNFELQWVNDLLSESIRRAGFTPCLNLDYLRIIDVYKKRYPIRSLVVGESSIQIYHMSEQFTKIINIQDETQLLVQNSAVMHTNHPVIIADCFHAEIHQLDKIEPIKNKLLLKLHKPLVFTYTSSTYVGEFIKEHWFIQPNKKGKPSLYYQSVQKEEISSLIHSLYVNDQWIKNKRFLDINWDLDEGKTQKIRVVVRGS